MAHVPRPKLTGWAAAASAKRSAGPAAGSHSGAGRASSTSSAAVASPGSSSGSAASLTPSSAQRDGPAHDTKDGKKTRRQRHPFNAQEVDTFLREHFKQHALKAAVCPSASRRVSWDTSTSSKWKSKRYGCLNEVAKALRS
ncbi:AFR594Wp [Eremothecium gossypii ATCC 10895]|uniref:AFR594Wp n=1 Tax=Eremothecium gossypii (strain ATCC 10895 / CBS 109.51 / FGSC 9923 / NRRL Y-1056) TaxID=284811 RepID=Q752I2_EREGS|nr:AFR594Wp [Eremothecium gossypii ATCC 10895]AAS53965.1 AFR594Wp [Eremothecium gossypii ATCC 10895]AEY98279.1 FAFR594Wp [Eremothecium gossypii FDAG1]